MKHIVADESNALYPKPARSVDSSVFPFLESTTSSSPAPSVLPTVTGFFHPSFGRPGGRKTPNGESFELSGRFASCPDEGGASNTSLQRFVVEGDLGQRSERILLWTPSFSRFARTGEIIPGHIKGIC